MKQNVRLSSYDAIIEAAYRVLGNNRAATLAEVAIAAGVGRATLHRHFASREDLIRALTFQAVKEIEETANTAAKGAWSNTNAMKKILYALIPLGERQLFLMNGHVEQFPEIQAELEKQDTEFMKVVKGAQKEGLFPQTCPAEWVMQTYDMLIFSAWKMVEEENATSKQAANLAWSTFKAGLKRAKL